MSDVKKKKKKRKAVRVHLYDKEISTCYMSIVFLQLVSLDPLVTAFLVDMNFMIIGTYGKLWKSKEKHDPSIKNELNQFLVSVSGLVESTRRQTY